MRVLIVLQHVNFYRNLDGVARALSTRGSEVIVLQGSRLDDEKVRAKLSRKMRFAGRSFELAQAEVPNVTVGYRPAPKGRFYRAKSQARFLVNRSIYLRKDHPAPHRVTRGLEKKLSPTLRRAVHTRVGRYLLSSPRVLRAWRLVEQVLPPSRMIVQLLRSVDPDVVLVSPAVWPKDTVEADYIRASKHLGIPTVGYINSWDNLTSKGTLPVLPDLLLVWNEALASEAETLHDVPREKIRATGAPHLDHFFEYANTVDEEPGPDRPYLVYLCSSESLIPSEVHLVDALADALDRHLGEAAPLLVVRPHPVNAGPWASYERRGVVVDPRDGEQADTPAAWREYFSQLRGACCVFGLNTTAFLEAVVADVPCLTIVGEASRAAQDPTGHFRHLLAGQFLEVAPDVDGVAQRVARICAGADDRASERRAFAESFLRPHGIDLPASTVIADEIESTFSKLTSRARLDRLDSSHVTAASRN